MHQIFIIIWVLHIFAFAGVMVHVLLCLLRTQDKANRIWRGLFGYMFGLLWGTGLVLVVIRWGDFTLLRPVFTLKLILVSFASIAHWMALKQTEERAPLSLNIVALLALLAALLISLMPIA